MKFGACTKTKNESRIVVGVVWVCGFGFGLLDLHSPRKLIRSKTGRVMMSHVKYVPYIPHLLIPHRPERILWELSQNGWHRIR